LYSGTAGLLWVLLDCFQHFSACISTEILNGLGKALADRVEDSLFHEGLYVGEGGVALTLWRLGKALDVEEYCSRARAISRRIARRPFTSPDLLNGTAGRARMHLRLAQWGGAGPDLANARIAADALVQQWHISGAGWPIPCGYGDLSGTTGLGYAHGAAGIASILVEMYEATAEVAYRDVAFRTADLILSRQHDVGRTWPRTLANDNPGGLYWCHGSAGIARFLMTARASDLRKRIDAVLATVAEDLGSNGRWMGLSLCHGISGNVDLLVDYCQFSGIEQKNLLRGWLLDCLVQAISCGEYDDLSLMTGMSGVMHAIMRSCKPSIGSTSLLT
jgi:lantibiotic modifying enzyme